MCIYNFLNQKYIIIVHTIIDNLINISYNCIMYNIFIIAYNINFKSKTNQKYQQKIIFCN
jgi:hypothetical protein